MSHHPDYSFEGRISGDVVSYYSQFFNVIAEIMPGLTDLHYGLVPPEERHGGVSRMWARLSGGPRRLLERVVAVGGLDALPHGARGLDIGCGLGGSCLYMSDCFGVHMVGVNLNGEQLRLAEARRDRHPARSRVTLLRGDAAALPVPEGTFDFAICIEVAFHVQHKGRLLAEAARAIRPGGTLILVDQEGEAPIEALGLFFFAAEGDFRRLAAASGLSLQCEADLSAEVSAWMEDYVHTAGLPFHGAALVAALVRGGPRLAWRYLRGVKFFSDLVRADMARRGISLKMGHPLDGVRLLRKHTLSELRSGRMRYKIFVFTKDGDAPSTNLHLKDTTT